MRRSHKSDARSDRLEVRSQRKAAEPNRHNDPLLEFMNKGILKMRKMKIKKTIAIPILLAAFVLSGCGKSGRGGNAKDDSSTATSAVAANKSDRKVLFWYDPMHPTVHFDHPGKSPFMDMELQPMYADQGNSNPNVISVDPAMVQDIGVVTAPVERRRLTRTINTYGVVMPDEKSIVDINTRVGGWIEKLNFDYTGMSVSKGEPMAVIYSPELIAAEQEFLQSVSFAGVSGNSVTSPSTLVQSARERLRFFGMSDKEIDALQSTGRVIQRVVIHSPGNGVILEKDVFEGQKITAGQSLFKVADLHRVWVLADVFKIDMPFLKLGSPASVEYDNSESYNGTVDFVYPQVDPTSRSVKVRIPLYNPGMEMKVGQYVNVAIHSPISYDALAVPSQAVINTGLRTVVAVALGGGKFDIRDIKLGAYADGYYEVTSGLSVGETIVTSGQFLLDSDANLHSAGERMTVGSNDSTAGSMEGMDMHDMKKGSQESGNGRQEHSGATGMKMESHKTATASPSPAPGLQSPSKSGGK